MKADWSDKDFTKMVFHKLAFTSYDVDLIHHGLVVLLASPSLGVGERHHEAVRWWKSSGQDPVKA